MAPAFQEVEDGSYTSLARMPFGKATCIAQVPLNLPVRNLCLSLTHLPLLPNSQQRANNAAAAAAVAAAAVQP